MLCADSLPKVGCDIHYLAVMTNLINDFLMVRYKFIAKESTYDVTEDRLTKSIKTVNSQRLFNIRVHQPYVAIQRLNSSY